MKKSTRIGLTFHYKGINKSGLKVIGVIKAHSLSLAKIELRKQGIMIHKVKRQFKPLFCKITSNDIAVFSRQLATMIEAGIPLVHSFDIIAKGQDNTRFSDLLETIKNDIATGLSLAKALLKHPAYFNELFCNLVDAGEKSGTLDIMLNKIATYKEKIETIKKKIKKALTYPTAILIVAVIVTAALLLFIVPQFAALFKNLGAELPVMTQAVVALSVFFQSYWYLILGFLAIAPFSFTYAKKHVPAFARFLDSVLLKFPVFGPILQKTIIARFARTLSITFAAGLPLVEALQSVAGTMGNAIFCKATDTIRDAISTGQQMNIAMKNTHLFPNMVVQMVAVGEESGTLENMLSKVADFYEEDVDNAVESFTSLLEPIIMGILGILVGGLVVSMYLPLFKLGSAI